MGVFSENYLRGGMAIGPLIAAEWLSFVSFAQVKFEIIAWRVRLTHKRRNAGENPIATSA